MSEHHNPDRARDYQRAADHAARRAGRHRTGPDAELARWADEITAALHRRNAEISQAGGVAPFPALFDLAGNLVAAKLTPASRYPGRFAWALLAGDHPQSAVTGWVGAHPKRPTTLPNKGYREGVVLAPARAKLWAPPGARGPESAHLVRVVDERTDGGFSRRVTVINHGLGPLAPPVPAGQSLPPVEELTVWDVTSLAAAILARYPDASAEDMRGVRAAVIVTVTYAEGRTVQISAGPGLVWPDRSVATAEQWPEIMAPRLREGINAWETAERTARRVLADRASRTGLPLWFVRH
ncbi:hypothetical protein O7626_14400 [Micromonospora sp. WMMD1102]|uniref:hypothetical protein n=1 Tax=Micromonospora sp. WMMD1102 TaxID=3016105 RepID=UPI0024158A99|nr:hypothetical protein [Micromonospora sp. WMMD1102]MDG4787105.1 hypothetical protein [Micromonospora sp. WMMD1102]